jgi:CHAD domain-containing protein
VERPRRGDGHHHPRPVAAFDLARDGASAEPAAWKTLAAAIACSTLVAKAKPIPDLSSGHSYAEAAARIVSVRAAELTEHAQGVLDTGDIERVHDMRVATRRLRAALEIFEPCFPVASYRGALNDVKRLADALGERRDRDVAIATLHGFNDKMPAPDRRGVQSLIGQLRREQEEANRALGPLVDDGSLRGLRESLDELVRGAAGVPT